MPKVTRLAANFDPSYTLLKSCTQTGSCAGVPREEEEEEDEVDISIALLLLSAAWLETMGTICAGEEVETNEVEELVAPTGNASESCEEEEEEAAAAAAEEEEEEEEKMVEWMGRASL